MKSRRLNESDRRRNDRSLCIVLVEAFYSLVACIKSLLAYFH